MTDLLADLRAEESAYCRRISELVYLVRIGPLRMTMLGLQYALRYLPNRDQRALRLKHGKLGYRWGAEKEIDGVRWAEVEIVPKGEGDE